jgi:hypothetical protein
MRKVALFFVRILLVLSIPALLYWFVVLLDRDVTMMDEQCAQTGGTFKDWACQR